jgi:hypothetical protein
MSDLTSAPTWSITDFFTSTGSTNSTLTFDLFKFISDKSIDVGSALGLIIYFYYYDRRMGVAVSRASIPIAGMLGANYLGLKNILGRTGGLVAGEYVTNKYYLDSYSRINKDEMMYGTGTAIASGYLFKYIYDTFVYKPSDATTA